METRLEENGSTAILHMEGQLNTHTAKEAAELFKEVGEKYDDLTLDLGGVKYISSAGIRELRNLYMVFYKKKGKLRMQNVNEVVMNVLEMTGLTGLLELG